MLTRRSILRGLVALAAPAIVRTPGLLMPVRPIAITTLAPIAELGPPWAILPSKITAETCAILEENLRRAARINYTTLRAFDRAAIGELGVR